MALPDFLREDLILLDLHPKDMEECVRSMVDAAAGCGAIADAPDALRRLIERERTMSTGMGGGVAVPHAKTDKVRNLVVAMARITDGVDFKAIDGKPVYLVFMLLGPPDSTRQHVDLLARIAYLVKAPGLIEAVRNAETPAQILEILRAESRDRRP